MRLACPTSERLPQGQCNRSSCPPDPPLCHWCPGFSSSVATSMAITAVRSGQVLRLIQMNTPHTKASSPFTATDREHGPVARFQVAEERERYGDLSDRGRVTSLREFEHAIVFCEKTL